MDFDSMSQMKSKGKSPLLILSTGGTIEKTYDESEGSLKNRETVIQEKILDELRFPHLDFYIKVVMQKDSLDMDDQDRLIIFEAIKTFERYQVPMIVLHGTDTMHKTILKCEELQQSSPFSVPVVFTGAMRPLGFVDSDAKQNVIESIRAATILEKGIFLNFHGKLFTPGTFKKSKELKTFIETEE